MDTTLLRQISILSAFLGFILGFTTLLPYINIVSFLFLIFVVGPVVLWLLLKYDCISLNTLKGSIVIGALSGFISYIAFSVIYIPCSIILLKIFHVATNYGIAMILNNANLFILIVISMFLGILSATLNAFTGFLSYYILELLNSIKK